jgi:ABC-2 type transport system permease protein
VEEVNVNAIYILWLRELKRYTRSRAMIVASLGQPLLYLLVLGFGLGPVFQKAGGGDYIQFIAPGIIGMSVLFTSVFSGIGLLWDRQFGFLKETLVAPVPRVTVMIGKTLGGATVATLQGLLVLVICLIAGFRPVNWMMLPVAIFFMILTAVVFAGLGVAIGSSLQDIQGMQLIMNFVVLPIYFLSGALFPLSGLPRVLSFLTHIDPLSYGIDALRNVLLAKSEFELAVSLAVLAVAALIFVALGSYSFSKIQL